MSEAWYLPIEVYDRDGGRVFRFLGCLPEDPNAADSPPGRARGDVSG